MRRYAEPVRVRRGEVRGWLTERCPQQFLWRERLWVVRSVLAHWVETDPWWERRETRAVLGSEEPGGAGAPAAVLTIDRLLGEQECWRVEARRAGESGVFDLTCEAEGECWSLVACAD
ncbi:DUF6504 family protein [Nocardioides acrostichi]|uniref:DUF6504 domain-containing protein n=1 Tax=Nocardioides acrostichi TaxID=2784339 RepID=A0A930UYS8_9ACTN|nr:DUF6504 family protein [Nocardioides acrostichi]MBF4160607.1 hypothetical protein [Nocardioides acrostichi]